MVYAVFMCMYLGTQLNSCKIYGSTCLNYDTRGNGYNCSPYLTIRASKHM